MSIDDLLVLKWICKLSSKQNISHSVPLVTHRQALNPLPLYFQNVEWNSLLPITAGYILKKTTLNLACLRAQNFEKLEATPPPPLPPPPPLHTKKRKKRLLWSLSQMMPFQIRDGRRANRGPLFVFPWGGRGVRRFGEQKCLSNRPLSARDSSVLIRKRKIWGIWW